MQEKILPLQKQTDLSGASGVEERKPWSKPELVELSVRHTQGGFITATFEGPFDFLFGS